jgi:hypothetical protein
VNAHLPETAIEQEPRLDPEAHQQEDTLPEEMLIGGSGLGHPEAIGMSLIIGVSDIKGYS